MARRPRRSAKRPTPRPARKPAPSPAGSSLSPAMAALAEELRPSHAARMAALKLKVEQLRREGRLPSQFDAVACWRGLLPKPVPLTPIMNRVPAGSSSVNSAAVVPADDEHATIARGLSDNARSVLRFLLDNDAVDLAQRYPKGDIADELGLPRDAVRVVRRRLAKLARGLIESKDGRGGGIWLSPAGKKVAAQISPQSCRQYKPQLKLNRHQTGTD